MQYVGHAGRSVKIERQIWSAIFDLTQAFQTAYQAFGRVAFENDANAKWRGMIPELHLPPRRPSRSRRQGAPLPLRSVDSRQMGRAPRTALARDVDAGRAAGGGRSTPERAVDDDRASVPDDAGAAAHGFGQPDARRRSSSCGKSSTAGARRCACRCPRARRTRSTSISRAAKA